MREEGGELCDSPGLMTVKLLLVLLEVACFVLG